MKNSMDVVIKVLAGEELDAAFSLIWEVFQEFVAPDYPPEGIAAFEKKFVLSETFRGRFREGRQKMYGAYAEGCLAGVLSVSSENTISCVFVKGAFHRRGIGKALFQTVLRELKRRGAKEAALNASPYALPFYHAMGFRDIGPQSVYQGIIYTPMKLEI